MGSAVEIKEIVVVTPSEPTPSHLLPLSALDSQLFLRFTIEYLLVYRSSSATAATTTVHSRRQTSARIKDALARALVPYYPLSGRVRPRPDGSGHLEVVCRAQGAYFIEATCNNTTVSDFARAPRYSAQWRKLLSIEVPDVLSGLPPLIVQLTWLSVDGDAAAIGVGFNHCICDGIGSAEFLNSFADLASGRQRLAELNPKPVWDRHLLNLHQHNNINITNTKTRSISHPEFNRVQDVSGFVSRFNQEPLTPTSVVFDRSSISELRKIAGSGSAYNNWYYTAFEVVAAHVWRCWARALEMGRDQTVRMIFSVNVRERVKPRLPSGYYGNGFVLGCAEASGRELGCGERGGPGPGPGLGEAAERVRRAKERVGEEYVRSVAGAVAAGACPDTSVGVLIVSQWSRLGLHNVDFGMGRPLHVGPVCTDRYCLILPVPNEKEAVRVAVALPRTAAAKYEYLVRNPS